MAENTVPEGTRAEHIAALLHNAPKPDAHDGVREYLRALLDAGLSVLLVKPGTKEPFDGRTARQRTADDKAAREEAREAGNRNWMKVRSPSGVRLATDDPRVLDGYLKRYLGRYIGQYGAEVAVNAAVCPGRSRLVVVDCDTAEQVSAFLADAGVEPDTVPTVRTPGQANAADEIIHSGGGHWWFTVPEGVELPGDIGSLSDADGDYSIMWGAGRYVLTPPSVRAEGAYEVPEVGTVHELPDWLRDRIIEYATIRAERAARIQDRGRHSGNQIEEWGATVTWAEILEDTDWTDTGKPDSCGCEIWTAPGLHASEKSATAHEPGCIEWTDSPDPPLHIWTDHDVEPFDVLDSATVTRLQAVALIHFDNDMGDAMTELDLHDGPRATFGPSQRDAGGEHVAEGFEGGDADLERAIEERRRWHLADREAKRRISAEEAAGISLPSVTSLTDFLAIDDDPVRFRIDDVFPAGGARIMFAAPEKAGKTTLLLNLTRSLADGDPFLGRFTVHSQAERIVVIDNEMSEAMTRRWLRRQGIRNLDAVADVVTLRGRAGLFDVGDDRVRGMWARRLADLGADFVILDCLRPALDALGLDENREAGRFLEPFDQLLIEAGVDDAVVAHHMGHGSERARGDSRIIGWSDGNWKIVRQDDNPESPKFFSALVRDGEPLPEGELTFDPASQRLIYVGGNRSTARAAASVEERLTAVLGVLADHEVEPGVKGMNTTDIKTAVGGNKKITQDALRLAEKRRCVTVTTRGRAKLYRLTPEAHDPAYMGTCP